MSAGRRSGDAPWKRIYGIDRAYARRGDRSKERGQYTEPGTPSNGPKKGRGK